ncbi:hypothetical protein ILUMI_07234 [Ignelater luminosus]|uniref:ABC transporter domain-containing protein n=1 Tax=Ignelater luminosus TaxID=2038154 RepID=A0A8K0D8Q1_IGNLU|nr:hypothetical protein ILUMI_07234 [Ignelater luminosus]
MSSATAKAMALTAKEDKNRSTSPLKCCQSSTSLTSTSNDGEAAICEAMTKLVVSTNGADLLETCNNNYRFHTNNLEEQMKKHVFPKRPPADLVFDNISYTTCMWSMTRFRIESKEILHGISGKFKSGELSAIMGPSGAGKTTLLNVLAGYITRGSSGSVLVNETKRDQSLRFRKLTAYIPQDEELRLELTAMEAMTVATNLKLGYTVSQQYKIDQATEILEMLGLERCHNTLTSRLSGGQRKRLAIALELINNPPIIFLDEPTTGLDSLSCSQCVSLLKRLAQEGRTIICTIHQPSALVFEMFDKLYALSNGNCIYQGPIEGLVPHLSSVGLDCPPYHNPADFLMEVAIGEHNADLEKLSNISNVYTLQSLQMETKEREVLANEYPIIDDPTVAVAADPIPASVLMQFFLLYKRNLLCARRNYLYLFNRLAAHIFIGFLFGYLYRGVGKGANTALANYVYLYGSLLLIVYTGKMSVTLSFPLEMKILNREHFNRWFRLFPYILSMVLVEIPFQIFCTWTYLAISYWLTEQPVDSLRIHIFVLFCTLSTLCAQSWGYFIGATTPIKIAVFVGPVLACLFSVFGFCIRYLDTPVIFRWMFHISYYRAGFHGVVYSMYGYNRTDLECPEELLYCHYKHPTKLLREMGITDVNIYSNISLIVVISLVMHSLTYISLWLKLNKR